MTTIPTSEYYIFARYDMQIKKYLNTKVPPHITKIIMSYFQVSTHKFFAHIELTTLYRRFMQNPTANYYYCHPIIGFKPWYCYFSLTRQLYNIKRSIEDRTKFDKHHLHKSQKDHLLIYERWQ